MSNVNKLISLLSLTAIVITVERFSPTTKILLQPYSYLRFHELFQMSIITFASVLISFLLLKVISNNFELLKDKKGTLLGLLFIAGTYFYATGNGAHEIASFLYNQYCNTKSIGTGFCASSFVDDYFFGNIVYFVGLIASNLSLVLIELRAKNKKQDRRNITIALANGIFFGLTLFL